ncbi:MAG: hypothetical protein IIC67_11550 [Thaumarchaeota archaeon]|nr:hypothetical protein [Nitrososphaerota archaeon]
MPKKTLGKILDFGARVLGFEVPVSLFQEGASIYATENPVSNIDRALCQIENSGKGQVLSLFANLKTNQNPRFIGLRQGYGPAYTDKRIKDKEKGLNANIYAFGDSEGKVIDLLKNLDGILIMGVHPGIEKQSLLSKTYHKILGIRGNLTTQEITSVNLEHEIQADELNFDFGTNFLEIIEMEPDELMKNTKYRKKRIDEIKQMINDNRDMLCLLAIRGIKNKFKINKNENEFLIQFQIDCGFKLIKVFFRRNQKALEDFRYFRNIVTSQKKTFVACIDEKLRPKIFEFLYLKCVENHDDIVSFFGRMLNEKNAPNFGLLLGQDTDNIIRLNSMIYKTNKNMINSVARSLLGFDCFSFLQMTPNDNEYFELTALDGLYFNTLKKDTPLVCVLTGENLFTSSGRFKKNQDFPYLPIYIHDIVRLNELFKILHIKFTYKKLLELFEDRVF